MAAVQWRKVFLICMAMISAGCVRVPTEPPYRTVSQNSKPASQPTEPAPVATVDRQQQAQETYAANYGGCIGPGALVDGPGQISNDLLPALEQLAYQSPNESPEAPKPVRGSLSKTVIRETIRSHIDEIRACYEQALVGWPRIEGRISVKFLIAPEGNLWKTAVANDTVGVDALACCITTAVSRWTFPPPEGGGIVIVTYPFVLREVPPESQQSTETAESAVEP
ncbi:MAG: AgmX/PglI C-terminal domain-containing protein [Myxococcales bacterium]|nr:AgmX/PglI C-terminal domain-containing protein [Myxococcales bacterium]